jgi:hypothetical protein
MSFNAMTRSPARGLKAAVLGTACLSVAGCQAAYFLTPERQQQVRAEYTRIGDRKLAVVVWADRPTLDVDPKARRRICEAVTYDLKKNLPSGRLVPAGEVEELQERSGLDWESMTSAEICRRLKCELVLRIDLLEYTSRAGDSDELRKGRVRGTVNLYEGLSDRADDAVYETEIVADYPPKSRRGSFEIDDAELLREATAQFGQAVARKFYDHEISLRGQTER